MPWLHGAHMIKARLVMRSAVVHATTASIRKVEVFIQSLVNSVGPIVILI